MVEDYRLGGEGYSRVECLKEMVEENNFPQLRDSD